MGEAAMIATPTLFDVPFYADGKTYEPRKDQERLATQADRVHSFMLSHDWVTIADLRAAGIQGSDSGLTARIRDMRKERYGYYNVVSRRVSKGVYAYKVMGRV